MEQIPTMNDVFWTRTNIQGIGKRNVTVGSYLSLEKTDHSIGNPDFIAGKALDDRIGCFILVLAERLRNSSHEIYYVFTVQEEVGLYGAKVSTYQIDPDLAVAVDVSNANDLNEEPTKILGEGPVITMKDDEMIGNTCLNNHFRDIAKKTKFPSTGSEQFWNNGRIDYFTLQRACLPRRWECVCATSTLHTRLRAKRTLYTASNCLKILPQTAAALRRV